MKTACVYHSIDLDGWMSAAIVKHWWLLNNKTNGVLIPPYVFRDDELDMLISVHNTITFIGYNYGEPIPNLDGYDSVIMVDISLPTLEMLKLSSKSIWIDHHVSAIKDVDKIFDEHHYSITSLKGSRDTKFAACELTWQHFFPTEPMPEIVRLLGRYDCFGHRSTDEETKVLEFQYGARQCIANYEEAYNHLIESITFTNSSSSNRPTPMSLEIYIQEKGKAIYSYLCTEAKQVYKTGFRLEFAQIAMSKPDGTSTDGWYYEFIAINRERFNPINFGINYHDDGYDGCACFHYDGVAKLWRFSLYNDNGNVNCSVIAKTYGGGGHAGAAGFVLTTEQFINLIEL